MTVKSNAEEMQMQTQTYIITFADALGTLGTLRIALRGDRGGLQEDPGHAGGSAPSGLRRNVIGAVLGVLRVTWKSSKKNCL